MPPWIGPGRIDRDLDDEVVEAVFGALRAEGRPSAPGSPTWKSPTVSALLRIS
jgi:hypothetical protein